jgi:hypothetical protein
MLTIGVLILTTAIKNLTIGATGRGRGINNWPLGPDCAQICHAV